MNGAVPDRDVGAALTVAPVGSDEINIGPIGITLDFLQVALPDAARDGLLRVTLTWEKVYRSTLEHDQVFLFRRTPVAAGGGETIHITNQVAYHIPEGSRVANFSARPELQSKTVRAKSVLQAEIKAGFGLDLKVFDVSAGGSVKTEDTVEQEYVVRAVSGALLLETTP